MFYFNFHIGDFLRDTAHLELEEEAIYRRLLDRYYLDEKPFSDDMTAICRVIRARGCEKMVKDLLEEFFFLEGDLWKHIRVEEELAKYREKSEKARNSAKARWNKSSDNANAERTHSGESPDGMLTNNQEPITNNQNSLSIINLDWIPEISDINSIAENIGVDPVFVLDAVGGFSAHFNGQEIDAIPEFQKWVNRERGFKE